MALGALPFDRDRAGLADRARGPRRSGRGRHPLGAPRSAPDADRRPRRLPADARRGPPATIAAARSDAGFTVTQPAVPPTSWCAALVAARDELRAGRGPQGRAGPGGRRRGRPTPPPPAPCWPAPPRLPGLHALRRRRLRGRQPRAARRPTGRRGALPPHGRHRAPQRRPVDRRPPGRHPAGVGQGPRRAPRTPSTWSTTRCCRGARTSTRRPSRRSWPWPTCSTWPPWSRAGCRRPPASVIELMTGPAPDARRSTARPASAALELIDRYEGIDRGRYAGPVGWVDADGNGAWAVGIRSAELDGTGPACSPASASSPTPTPTPSWPRPRPSSRPSSAPSPPLTEPPAPETRHLRTRMPTSSMPSRGSGRQRGGDGGVDLAVDGHVGGPVGADDAPRGRRRAPADSATAAPTSAWRSTRRRARCRGRAASAEQVDAVGRPEQLLEAARRRARRPGAGTRRCRRRRCRRPRSCRSMPAPGRAEQAVGVVQEGDVADEQRGRSGRVGRRARATPTAVDTTPSMPLAPRLASTREAGHAGAANHSTSRTGIDDDTTSAAPSGSGRDDLAGDRRLGRLGVAGQHRGDRLGRRPRPRAPTRRATRRPGRPRPPRSPRRSSRAPASGGTPRPVRRPRSRRGCDPGRSARRRPRWRAARRRDRPATGPSTFEAGSDPSRSTTSGASRRATDGTRRRASKWLTRSTARAVRHPLRGSASTGQPSRSARSWTSSGSVDAAAGDDHAASALDHRRSGCRRSPRPARRTPRPARARRRRGSRPAGRRPGSPTSGSRNGRLRCTGPGGRSIVATTTCAASDRQRARHPLVGHARVDEAADRAAEQVLLVDRLRRARRRGARAAGRRCTTSSGTRASWASTTAGCSSTAAVPLVVSTSAGRPADHAEAERDEARPTARRGATCSAHPPRRRPAPAPTASSASPGATTASVTPARTHSSTSVAQKVAAAVRRIRSGSGSGTATAYVWCHRGQPTALDRPTSRPAGRPSRRGPRSTRAAARAGARLHPDLRVLGADRRRPGRRPRAGARRRARPRRVGRRPTPTCGRRRRASADGRRRRPPTSATRWAGASACTLALDHPDAVDRPGPRRRDGRARRRRRARPTGGPADEQLADHLVDVGVAALRRRVAGPAAVRDPAARARPPAGPAAPTPRPGWRRACAWPAPARRSRCGIGWASWRCRCWSWPARSTPKYVAARPSGWSRPSAPNAELAVDRRRRPHRPPRAARRLPRRPPRLARPHSARLTDRPASNVPDGDGAVSRRRTGRPTAARRRRAAREPCPTSTGISAGPLAPCEHAEHGLVGQEDGAERDHGPAGAGRARR